MESRTDAELVAMARAGNKAAFGQLARRYQFMALRIAQNMVRDEELGLELAQEAFLQAYLSLDSLRNEASFASWLNGIALNVCRNYIREQKAVVLSLEALAGGVSFERLPFSASAPDPQQVAEERELQRLILRAIESLSPKNKATTLLFYYEQLSLQEIATLLGISIAAVKVRLHRSRQALQQLLLPLLSSAIMDEQKEHGRKTMIPVTIADVIKQEHRAEEKAQPSIHYVVVMLDEEGKRVLPIWVGPAEGQAITTGVRELSFTRPLTFDFMARLLEATGARVEAVHIDRLQDMVFYATVRLQNGAETREIDARPSDALALAVRTKAPIYVAPEVLEQGGTGVPEAAMLRATGTGLDIIGQEMEAMWWEAQAAFQSETEADVERAKQELLAIVFEGNR